MPPIISSPAQTIAPPRAHYSQLPLELRSMILDLQPDDRDLGRLCRVSKQWREDIGTVFAMPARQRSALACIQQTPALHRVSVFAQHAGTLRLRPEPIAFYASAIAAKLPRLARLADGAAAQRPLVHLPYLRFADGVVAAQTAAAVFPQFTFMAHVLAQQVMRPGELAALPAAVTQLTVHFDELTVEALRQIFQFVPATKPLTVAAAAFKPSPMGPTLNLPLPVHHMALGISWRDAGSTAAHLDSTIATSHLDLFDVGTWEQVTGPACAWPKRLIGLTFSSNLVDAFEPIDRIAGLRRLVVHWDRDTPAPAMARLFSSIAAADKVDSFLLVGISMDNEWPLPQGFAWNSHPVVFPSALRSMHYHTIQFSGLAETIPWPDTVTHLGFEDCLFDAPFVSLPRNLRTLDYRPHQGDKALLRQFRWPATLTQIATTFDALPRPPSFAAASLLLGVRVVEREAKDLTQFELRDDRFAPFI